jgi:cellulose biosynthesis protein BcsQ
MLISVLSLQAGCGQSTCAVNLASELAALPNPPIDRWQGTHSVILSAVPATYAHYATSERLPVSCDLLTLSEASSVKRRIEEILSMATEVDYVVIDGPSSMNPFTEQIVLISDLVVIPCSGSQPGLVQTEAMMKSIGIARSVRTDGGPKCLLVPVRVGPGAEAVEEISAALQQFKEPIGPPIHQAKEFTEAFWSGSWIGETAFDSAPHREIQALAREVERLLGMYASPKKTGILQGF